MKFSLLQRGTRAEREVELPGATTPEATAVKMMLRPLTGAEEATVLEEARRFARGRGVDDPKRGDALYDLGAMVHTLALACLDPDSPSSLRAAFFDQGATQILEHVSRETIAYLYERQEAWQAECSPYRHQMTAAELLDAAKKEAASDDERFFSQLSPATRWSFTHILACVVVNSPEASLLLGSVCAASGPTASASPPSG